MKRKEMNKILYRICLCAAALYAGGFTGASAQYILKETLPGFSAPVAVFYADGMPDAAVWPFGTNLMRNGATIRHNTSGGNENNPNINGRVPARFIVAPADIAPGTWANVSGFEDAANYNTKADFTKPVAGAGCRGLTTGGRSWRLPTVGELLMIRIFQEAVDAIYPAHPMIEGEYWSSTESTTSGNSYSVVFGFPATGDAYLAVYTQWYNSSKPLPVRNARCVSDY
ncbi:DUF1566 domain-containing protein [Coprobacter tertius]|uniref:DUF1566 domain-containing protein n=1 Tax=Coprobacter tertius TaxID=2944915 RepID=A0ABT1MDY9_9BACT|nr:DUF1566 domain-containing protein [Coprobacter tertius]MCP9610852.1 DUF1566 domain-containing protein [Coprobacter tertius]